jgi:hypothetical protein
MSNTDRPGLQIDTDWKRQAQEEKQRLAEQEKTRRAAEQPAPAAAPSASRAARGGSRELPVASFSALVQQQVTQILYYLGDLAPQGSEPAVSLDMAKHYIDVLGVLEEKTRGNLTDDEKHILDAALYEVRMRYVSVAQQYIR